jgi:hypothetical protein
MLLCKFHGFSVHYILYYFFVSPSAAAKGGTPSIMVVESEVGREFA